MRAPPADPTGAVVEVDGAESDLKLDLRAYVYQGAIQFLAARLYAGQTTNFRTPGEGFAPMFVAPEKARVAAQECAEVSMPSCMAGANCSDSR
jgi:hypothetical protein